MKVTLEKVSIFSTDRNNNPLVNVKGEAYKKASIMVNGEWYGMYLGGKFPNDERTIAAWQVGQIVDVILYEEKGYKNFKLPGKLDGLEERVARIEQHLGLGAMPQQVPVTNNTVNASAGTNEQDLSEIPF